MIFEGALHPVYTIHPELTLADVHWSSCLPADIHWGHSFPCVGFRVVSLHWVQTAGSIIASSNIEHSLQYSNASTAPPAEHVGYGSPRISLRKITSQWWVAFGVKPKNLQHFAPSAACKVNCNGNKTLTCLSQTFQWNYLWKYAGQRCSLPTGGGPNFQARKIENKSQSS